MTDTFLKTLMIVAIIGIMFYLIFSSMKKANVFEGLDNQTGGVSATPSVPNGFGGNAAAYATAVKAQVTQMQDQMLISKYRKDYETAIINLEDLINYSMLSTALQIKSDSKPDELKPFAEYINTLSSAKDNLNSVMKFLDSK
jgi:hypothetical protein